MCIVMAAAEISVTAEIQIKLVSVIRFKVLIFCCLLVCTFSFLLIIFPFYLLNCFF